MSAVWWWLLALAVWVIVGCTVFVCRLGHKHGPEPWWVGPAISGVLPVIALLVLIRKLRGQP